MSVGLVDSTIQTLIQAVVAKARLVRVSALSGGMSAQMSVVEIQCVNGEHRRLVLRQCAGANRAEQNRAAKYETELLRLTREAGITSPASYMLSTDNESCNGIVIMECVDGEPNYDPPNRLTHAGILAEQLATIHRVDCVDSRLAFLAVRTLRSTEPQTGPFDEADASLQARKIRAALDNAKPLVQDNLSTLLHGDFWPGNVLWREQRLVAVVDWEDACFGDPLFDLSVTRLDLAWILGIDAMDAFTERYRSLMAIDYRNLPLWDLLAALRLIRISDGDFSDWAASWRTPSYNRADITERWLRDVYQTFLTRAFTNLARQ